MKSLGFFLTAIYVVIFFTTKQTIAQNGVGVNTITPASSFEVYGSYGQRVHTITASTTLDDTYNTIVCNNGVTAITITLPTASTCAGRIYQIKKNSTSTANVTLSATIDGASNLVLTGINQAAKIFSDGTEWKTIIGGAATNASAWSLTGNSGTSVSSNFIGTTDAVDWVMKTNNAERARITSGGSILMGTTSNNGDILQVNGTQTLWGSFYGRSPNQVYRFGTHTFDSEVSTVQIGLKNGSAMMQFISGNYPPWVSLLQLTNYSGYQALTMSAGNSDLGGGIQTYGVDARAVGLFQNNADGRLFMSIGGSNYGTMLSNGYFGLGTTSPTERLDVAGKTRTTTFQMTTSPANGYFLQSDASGNGSWFSPSAAGSGMWSTLGNVGTSAATNFIGTTDAVDWVMKTNNTERARVTSGGSLLLGTTFNNNDLLQVAGNQTLWGSFYGRSVNQEYVFGMQPTPSGGATVHIGLNSGNGGGRTTIFSGNYGNWVDLLLIGNTAGGQYMHMVNGNGDYGAGIRNGGVDSRLLYLYNNNPTDNNGVGSTTAISLETNGTFRAGLSYIGYWGIGVYSPNSHLHVNGSFAKIASTITASTTLNDAYSTVVCNNEATAITVTLPAANTCAGRIYDIKRNNASTANVSIVVASSGTIDAAASRVLTQANQAVSLFSDGSEWKTMVGGAAANATSWGLTGNSGTSTSANFIGTTDAVDFVMKTNGAERMRIDATGNVGIGTSIPDQSLVVNGIIQAATTGNNGNLYLGGSNVSLRSAYSLNVLGIYTSNIERMRVDQNGNVGIGTTSPGYKLDVQGTGNFESNVRIVPQTSSWAEGLQFYMPNTSTWGGLRWSRNRGGYDGNWYMGYTGLDATDDLVFGANNGGSQVDNIVRLTKAGNVGIGTSSPSERLSVAGNICYTGSIGACSDIRYKKDITPLSGTLVNIMKLNGVTYNWKRDEFKERNFEDRLQIGLIAQEVEKIYPELVQTDKNGYKSVDYSRLTPVLIEALKEEHRQLVEQKNIIQQQTEKIKSIEAKNERTEKNYTSLKAEIESMKATLFSNGITNPRSEK